MAAPSTIVGTLGELLTLLQRDPTAAPDVLLRQLAAELGAAGASLSADGFGLSLDGLPLPAGTPGAEPLFQALHHHRVGRIVLGPGASPTVMAKLFRALAAAPGSGGGPEALAMAAGLGPSDPITLEAPRRLPKASDTIRLDAITAPTSTPTAPEAPGSDLFPDLDALSAGRHPGPAVSPPAAAPTPAAPGGPPPEAPPPPGGISPARPAAAPVSFRHVPLPDLLDRLERAPDAPEAGMILQHVSTLLRRLAEEHRLEDLLSAGAALLRAEVAATTPESARRYDLALRRALTRPALRDLVPLVVMGPYRAEGFPVFRRGGADATDTLLDFLVAAPTVDERAAAFRALQAMTEGTQSIVHMLQHDAWYVLRNVAELCGVMGLVQAAPRLAALLGHGDERVRRAAAGALARLEGPDALEGTRRALQDASPVVRLEAAKAVGGARSRGLAMPIALRLGEEPHADVERELLLALGRIGTPEAVQALGKAAEPGGRFRGRKSAATRLAAVEGLRLAGGQGAQRRLLALASDPDREVAAAASRAVDAIAG